MLMAATLGAVVALAPAARAQSAQPAPPPAPPPPTAPPPTAPPPAAPPPEAWFPQPDQPRPDDPPQPDGAYVQQPSTQTPATPEPPPDPPPPYVEPAPSWDMEPQDTALLMAMIAVRPFVTSVDADGAEGDDDPTSIPAGHVGFRAHGNGVTDDMILRAELEGFLGASTEGVEVEGRGFFSLGLATPIERVHFLFFRFGAGGSLFGNPVVDYQVASLPALEFGYLHGGADGYVEIAPLVAMGVSHMEAFSTGEWAPDPTPAIGGHLLVGGEAFWGTVEYQMLTGEKPMHVGGLTACFADKFSVCLDGRLASASLDFAAPLGSERVNVLSGGLSFGLGQSAVEH
jgi:hypothetical protein